MAFPAAIGIYHEQTSSMLQVYFSKIMIIPISAIYKLKAICSACHLHRLLFVWAILRHVHLKHSMYVVIKTFWGSRVAPQKSAIRHKNEFKLYWQMSVLNCTVWNERTLFHFSGSYSIKGLFWMGIDNRNTWLIDRHISVEFRISANLQTDSI